MPKYLTNPFLKAKYRSQMERLNYHHLRYFWVVASEGGLARASAELRVAQPTLSTQIHQLEDALGEKLFARAGRNLVLTDTGVMVFRYAEEIFSVGQELIDTLQGRPATRPTRFVVGVADVLPKLLVHRLLEPAFHLGQPVRLICREDSTVEDFLGELAVQELDLVLADRPMAPAVKVRAYNHLLGKSGTSFLAKGRLAAAHRRRFPDSLDGAPCLLPGAHTTLRRSLEKWLDSRQIRPLIVAEFDDSALMYVFGQKEAGIFPVPTAFEAEFQRVYDVKLVGRLTAVHQSFYAISVDRNLKHPAVIAVCDTARRQIFR